MSKGLRVAGEVDSWCTRCRLVLNHRIVSMKVGRPHQVECLTCRTQHLFRPAAPGTSAGAGAGSASKHQSDGRSGLRAPGTDGKAGAGSRSAKAAGVLRYAQEWEQAIAGRAVLDFKPYSVASSFVEGDLVRHKKFGDGVVKRVINENKIEVIFRDEPRTLVQGMS